MFMIVGVSAVILFGMRMFVLGVLRVNMIVIVFSRLHDAVGCIAIGPFTTDDKRRNKQRK